MVLLLSSKPCCEVNGAALAASFFETLAGGLAQPRAADFVLDLFVSAETAGAKSKKRK